MNRFCSFCGASLPDECRFCPTCGAAVVPVEEDIVDTVPENPVNTSSDRLVQPPEEVSADTPTEVGSDLDFLPEESSETPRKRRRWIIPAVSVAAFLAVVALIWQPLFLRLLPHAYLGWTMSRTTSDIEKRQAGGPGELLKVVEDYTKKGTMTLSLDVEDRSYYGGTDLSMDLSVANDVENKEWQYDLKIESAAFDLDLESYVNDKYITLGSDTLTDGTHYGLEYKTAEEDLRNSVLGEKLNDEQIDAVVEFVEMIEKITDSAGSPEEKFKPYKDVIEQFIKDLDPEIGKEKLDINGKNKTCDTMAFTLDQDQIVELLEELLDVLEDDPSLPTEQFGENIFDDIQKGLNLIEDETGIDLVLTYYFYRNKVAALNIELNFEIDENDVEFTAELMINYGANAAKNDVVTTFIIKSNGESIEGQITSTVKKDDDCYEEIIVLTVEGDPLDEDLEFELSITWNKDDDELEIGVSGEVEGEDIDFTLPFVLEQDDYGFTFGFKDLGKLISNVNPEYGNDMENMKCSFMISFSTECDIDTPHYTSIDNMTIDDFQAIRDNIMSLM